MTKISSLTIYEVVKRLIGPFTPIGDHGIDLERLDNLNQTIDLVERLTAGIASVEYAKTRNEASMRAVGERAAEFLDGYEKTQ